MTRPLALPARVRPHVDVEEVAALYRRLLLALGEDPDREGLADTPRRVAAWWQEFLDYDPGRTDTAFAHAEGSDQLVLVAGIGAWSLCEHHLLPFRLSMAVGYVPAGRLVGLSKLARIAAVHAHRLQVQERLTDDVAHAVAEVTGSPDVAVLADAEHLCMSMRGIRAEAARTTTSRLLGRLRTDTALVDRLYAIVYRGGHR
jgi:GTP cyclohydrolase IA